MHMSTASTDSTEIATTFSPPPPPPPPPKKPFTVKVEERDLSKIMPTSEDKRVTIGGQRLVVRLNYPIEFSPLVVDIERPPAISTAYIGLCGQFHEEFVAGTLGEHEIVVGQTEVISVLTYGDEAVFLAIEHDDPAENERQNNVAVHVNYLKIGNENVVFVVGPTA